MAPDKNVSVILRLHQGLGVRESNLAATMAGTTVASNWLISGDDLLSVVRAKVIYRLEVAFAALGSPERDVWRVVYNATDDLPLHDRSLRERKDVLPELFPTLPVRGRSADRCIQLLRDELERHTFRARHAPFDRARLPALLRVEEDIAARAEPADRLDGFRRLVAAAYESPIRPAQSAFLKQRVCTPLSATGDLVVARARLGPWVCAFSDIPAMHAFQDATPQEQHGRFRALTGADLIREVDALRHSIGIVVNPPPIPSDAPNWTARATLPIGPDDVARLAADLPA